MMNPRILIAGAIALLIIMGSMSWVTNKGLDKALPALEQQKQKAAEIQQKQAEMIRQDLMEMGASEEVIRSSTIPPTQEEMADYVIKSPTPRKPIGNWAGLRKGKETNIAFMKFDNDDYWLLVKATGGEYKEKGKYEFEFDRLNFVPESGEPYDMEFYMNTLNNIEFFSPEYSLTLEKTNNIDIDF